MRFTVPSITSKTLRRLRSGLLHRPYSMKQASYDLARQKQANRSRSQVRE